MAKTDSAVCIVFYWQIQLDCAKNDLQKLKPKKIDKKVHFSVESYQDFCASIALYLNEDSAILQDLAASASVIFPSDHNRKICGNSAGSGLGGRPKRTPFLFAAAIPSACRFRMFSRSFCATKESTCNTRSAMNVPSKSLSRRVSRRGMSSTQMSTFFAFVSSCHCRWISS